MIFQSLFSMLVIRTPLILRSKPGLKLYPFKINDLTFSTTLIAFRTDRKSKTSGVDASKARIILELNFKSADDCIPFYKLTTKQLIQLLKITKNDERENFCENRLYYIASKIKCPPALVSEQLAKRTFVYNLSFDWLQKSLDTLIENGVTGDRILRDLWVLKYHHKTISERLQHIKEMGADTMYPWMVRCTPDILNRYITLSQETKSILGGTQSTKMYLANRLNTSVMAIDEMCTKMPALRTIRVTKIKHFLDFLLDEGFEVEDIANKPRILASSQKTIKYRLDILRKLGLNDINLNTLCRSRKEFQKYYESLEAVLKDSSKSTTSA